MFAVAHMERMSFYSYTNAYASIQAGVCEIVDSFYEKSARNYTNICLSHALANFKLIFEC